VPSEPDGNFPFLKKGLENGEMQEDYLPMKLARFW